MKKKTTEEFIIDAYCKHGDTYNYSLIDYKNTSTKVKIICPDHGIFEQKPNHHLRGQGCKKCGHIKTNKKTRKSTEEFIIDAYCKHGDTYNYSLVDYKNKYTKVKIICPVHGVFEQQPNNHLRYGCGECGNIISGIKQRFNINQYIKRCKTIHNNKYDYSLIENGSIIKDKVKIICPIHGVFEQKIGNHLYKEYGCPKCSCIVSKQELELQDWIKSMARKLTTEQFIKKAISVHGPKYDYSLVDYKNTSTKVKIICKEHGTFEQKPNDHLNGSGCRKCQYDGLRKTRKSTEEFIVDAYCKHQDKYNYSLVDYKGASVKVKIICPEHGTFEQKPSYHLQGNGCPECGILRDHRSISYYIQLCDRIHDNKYDYSLVKGIKNSYTKVLIICPVHGIFEQRLNNHIHRESGCPKCSCIVSKQELELQDWIKSMGKKLTTEEFIEKARKTHNNKYDYSLVDYRNAITKVKIICPEHGVFEQKPNNHINLKQGCPKCSIYINGKDTEQFIIDAYCKHQDKYNYSLVNYKGARKKVKIICPAHGTFEQRPDHHINGNGCRKCQIDNIKFNNSIDIAEFIQRSNKIHNNKYNYSLVDYKNAKTKVKIICPDHGVFAQIPDSHLKGSGCPKCSCIVSKQELELQGWMNDDITIETNNRSIINPFELDIVIPEKKIAIEYNGLYWHSETQGKDRKYHLNKYNLCKEQGYRLIQIWENEWLFKQDIVKSFLLSAINKYKYRVHGRKCVIRVVSAKEARVMYNNNHLQGFQSGTHHGLYYKDELVSLMTIKRYLNDYMLERFVNKTNYNVHGAFSKLLKSFNNIITGDLYTFADVRHFTGDVYSGNGFDYVHTTLPNYWYFKNGQTYVYHRRHFQKKNIEKKYNKGELEFYNPNETEYQNMINNGYHRIWDCGNIKFVKKYKG